MTRVLVTGGAGFLGSHLVEHLLKTTDDEIVVLDRLDETSTLHRIGDTEAYRNNRHRVSVVWHDLRAPMSAYVYDRIGQVSVAYHLAASTHVDRSIVDPLSFVQDNVVGTVNLLQWARRANLHRFVYFSTDEVFGPAAAQPDAPVSCCTCRVSVADGGAACGRCGLPFPRAPSGHGGGMAGHDDEPKPSGANRLAYGAWDRYRSSNPYCLHPDTEIPYADGSWRRIGADFRDQRAVPLLSYDFREGRVVAAVPVCKIKIKAPAWLFRIETQRTTITCSPEHRFFVRRPTRWASGKLARHAWAHAAVMEIRANELRIGDFVAAPRHVPAPMARPFTTPPIARLLGYFVGDGNLNRYKYNRYIRFAEGDRALLSCYEGVMRVALAGWQDGGGTPAVSTYKHSTKRCWYAQVACRRLFDLIESLGLNKPAANKVVPEELMTASDDEVLQFIAGLFDADGTSSKGTVTFGSASRDLLQGVAKLLRRFGILTGLTKNRPRFYKLTVGDAVSLAIFRRVMPVFKKLRLGVIGRPQERNADDNIAWSRVQSVRQIKSDTGVLYDFDVPPWRNYIAAGLVVHNSASKAAGEEFALAYCNTYGVPVLVTHCVNAFGERQYAEKYLPLVIRRLLAGETIFVHADKDRVTSASRHYVHARNVAAALHWLVDESIPWRPTPGSKINLGGQVELAADVLAERVAGILGVPAKLQKVAFHASRPGHDMRYALVDDLGPLGFAYPVDFDESLERTVKWYQSNPTWLAGGPA